MRMKAVICFYITILLILFISTVTTAETGSTEENERKSVYELHAVYSLPVSYQTNFGIGMQGKYYLNRSFYMGWYTPVRMILIQPYKQPYTSVDSEVIAKLMGTAGLTSQTRYFDFHNNLQAGWRYWYTKSTVNNPAYNINGTYESSTTVFEVGLQTDIRWKVGKAFQLKSYWNNISLDFYAYWPLTDDFFKSEFDTELALGLTYTF